MTPLRPHPAHPALAGTLMCSLLARCETVGVKPLQPHGGVSRETSVLVYWASNKQGMLKEVCLSLTEGNCSCYTWDINRETQEKHISTLASVKSLVQNMYAYIYIMYNWLL